MIGQNRADVAIEIEVLLRRDRGVAQDEHRQDPLSGITRRAFVGNVSFQCAMPKWIHEPAVTSARPALCLEPKQR